MNEPIDLVSAEHDIPNRYGRTAAELAEVRARIADARKRAATGQIKDDSEWGQQKLAEERRKLTAR